MKLNVTFTSLSLKNKVSIMSLFDENTNKDGGDAEQQMLTSE